MPSVLIACSDHETRGINPIALRRRNQLCLVGRLRQRDQHQDEQWNDRQRCVARDSAGQQHALIRPKGEHGPQDEG
jgi:hypothetical protein